MGKIKRIVSMCPAAPDWFNRFKEDGEPLDFVPVALWVLVELKNSEQVIIGLDECIEPTDIMGSLEYTYETCRGISFGKNQFVPFAPGKKP